MTNTQTKKCAHPVCRCTVTDDKKYCSQRCEDAKGEQEISCDCAHPGCSLSE
jgi:predicted nucleic acid-binding Zn ribbon protein